MDVELVPVSGLGRGDAPARAGGCDRRPRLDRLDVGANGLRLIGALLASQAVLIGGRNAVDAAARARRAPRADALRRGRRASAALRDDERDDRDAAGDPRRPAEHGRADRGAARATRGRSPCTRRSTRTRCGRCSRRCRRRRRDVDPRRARSRGSFHEGGARARRRDRRRGADRRRRTRPWRRRAARVDGAVRRAAARTASRAGSADCRGVGRGRRARGAARDDPCGSRHSARRSAPRHVRGGGARDRLRAALASARFRRHLRAERPFPAAVVARDGGRACARRRRAADRDRDAEPGRRDPRGCTRARAERGLRRRRRAGRRGAGLRHRDDPGASTGSSAPGTRT